MPGPREQVSSLGSSTGHSVGHTRVFTCTWTLRATSSGARPEPDRGEGQWGASPCPFSPRLKTVVCTTLSVILTGAAFL